MDMLNDVINLLELHLRDGLNFRRLGQNEKADKEVEIVNVALLAMSAMTKASFRLCDNNAQYDILLKSKDNKFTIVLATVYKF